MQRIQRLEMVNISKSFHGTPANKNISLHIQSGEILGLLGENGAGKTTLMNILYGLYQPDSGEIKINGNRIRILNPVESINHGIGMVHQHFMLVQNHTVIENIVLGYKNTPFFFPKRAIRNKVIEFSKQFDFKMDPEKKIWQLSAGEQQRVEIIKALLNEADVLILDEPTSVLTPLEITELFSILKAIRDRGRMIIFISHKLDEITHLCDRVTVIQKGETVGNVNIGDTNKKALARMMVGRDVIFNISREMIPPGDRILSVEHLRVLGDKGNEAVKDISFDLYQNEIFGIAGVAGNGQRELAEAITGIRPAISGCISINGKNITNKSPRYIYDEGISHIPEERIRFGIAPGLLLYDNSILKQHHHKKFSGRLFIRYPHVKSHARTLVEHFRISAHSIYTQTRNLSGGNIQKLILGREINETPLVLVASHPTYGLDVGATEYLRQLLLDIRKQGSTVLLFSEDLEEIFELCDRIAVIFDGEFTGVLPSDDPRLCDIGMMMAGTKLTDIQENAHADQDNR